MGEGVKDTRYHLVFRYTVGKLRVQDGKLGIERIIPAGSFPFCGFVGDDSIPIHFRTGPYHRENSADGERGAVQGLLVLPVLRPDVTLFHSGDGDALGAVNHRATAHGENQVCLAGPGQAPALQNFFIGGVGQDTRKLCYGFSAGLEGIHNLIVYPVPSNGIAAVGQQNAIAIQRKHGGQILHGRAAKKHLGWIKKFKIVLHFTPSL